MNIVEQKIIRTLKKEIRKQRLNEESIIGIKNILDPNKDNYKALKKLNSKYIISVLEKKYNVDLSGEKLDMNKLRLPYKSTFDLELYTDNTEKFDGSIIYFDFNFKTKEYDNIYASNFLINFWKNNNLIK